MSGLTTHVLDTSMGRPAAGVMIRLERRSNSGQWAQVGEGATDSDGRQTSLLGGDALRTGSYRLTFDSGDYFQASGRECFFPHVAIEFQIMDASQHYHVPLLLSPYGYSTYRGS